MKFRVIATEQHSRTIVREKVFEAESIEEARELAESEDWRGWSTTTDGTDVEAFIESIEEEK